VIGRRNRYDRRWSHPSGWNRFSGFVRNSTWSSLSNRMQPLDGTIRLGTFHLPVEPRSAGLRERKERPHSTIAASNGMGRNAVFDAREPIILA